MTQVVADVRRRSTAAAPILEVDGLEVVYHGEEATLAALRDVGFAVRPAEIVGIVGESGCGKSTLASTLLRLLPPNGEIRAGRIVLDGRDLVRLSQDEMRGVRGREIAMIFQDPMTSLNPALTVGDQMVEAQKAHLERRAGRAALRRRAVAALAEVGIPDAADRIDAYPHEFSGGQRQRIMIATALLLEPAVLVADEPTSALDVTLEAQILELLRRLRRDHGTAILFVSHDLGVVAQLCDRVVVMYAGCAVEEGDAADLFAQPLHPYTQALLASIPSREQRGGRLVTIPGRVPSLAAIPQGCKFAERCSFAEPEFHEREPRLIELGTGRRVRCHRYEPGSAHERPVAVAPIRIAEPVRSEPRAAATADALVQVRDLRTHFAGRTSVVERLVGRDRGAVRAVDGVDLEIRRGEVVGLVGESGSGKTTLGETILRLVAATSGEVLFDGEDVLRLRSRGLRRLRRRAQMIFQDPISSLSPRQRVGSLLTEPYRINDVPDNERYSVSELLEMVGLSPEQATKYPNQLSGGQARRVGIARALALHPELVVADEPTSGLDVSAAAAVLNLMKDLGERLGLTYLIITHNLNLVAYMADRIAVMYLGEIVELGPTERILEAPAHPYTKALLSLVPHVDASAPREHRLLVPGEIPSPRNPPPGCRFHTRCAFAELRSREVAPVLEEIEEEHFVACHFWHKVRASV